MKKKSEKKFYWQEIWKKNTGSEYIGWNYENFKFINL